MAVLLNDGMGRFLAAQPVHSGFEPTLIVAADFNGDLAVDLAVGNTRPGNQSIAVLLATATGHCGPRW